MLILNELKTNVANKDRLSHDLNQNLQNSSSWRIKKNFRIKSYFLNNLMPVKCSKYIDHLPNVYFLVIFNEGKAIPF